MINRNHSLGYWLIVSLVIFYTSFSQANGATGWENAAPSTFSYWSNKLGLPPAVPGVLNVDRIFTSGEELVETHIFPNIGPIHGLNISGSVILYGENSLVRVVLVDDQAKEHLVYESDQVSVSTTTYPLQRVCEETCFLDSIVPSFIRIELINSEVIIGTTDYSTAAAPLGKPVAQQQLEIKQAQSQARIQVLNSQIKEKGLKWVAGETSVSLQSYSDKKKRFGIPADNIMNLQGAEYYKGGVFEIKPGGSPSAPSSVLTNSFDWRNRHGANREDSPYYDGDTTGSGWITSVKDQDGCGSCWAFAATGATEALANLYFNRHVDFDLSEQDALSCSGAGTCAGGWPGSTLDYYTTTGVVDEGCFPYSATDEVCANKCSDPSQLVQINGRIAFPPSGEPKTDDTLKTMIMNYGPISGGIRSWLHAMTLVGFNRDPDDQETIWIFKNSWGANWGENGYGYIKIPIADISWTHALLTPITSQSPQDIRCVDLDGDGLYNWGIGDTKPIECPAAFPDKDCDDSNLGLGPIEPNGSCAVYANSEEFLLTANEKPVLGLHFNRQSGKFFPPIAVGDYANANYAEMTISDFNNDDNLDFIAGTNENPSRLYYYQRIDASNFRSTFVGLSDPDPKAAYFLDPLGGNNAAQAPDYGLGLTAVDLDNDGDMDFLENINHHFEDEKYWIAKGNAYLNDGSGNFTKTTNAYDFTSIYTGWALGISRTLADVDGDDIPDLLASEQSSGGAVNSKVYLLRGNGDGSFQTPQHVFTTNNHPATYMALGDFTNNGKVDALVGQDDDGDPGAVFLFKGLGDGSFAQTGVEAFDTREDIESGSDRPGHGSFHTFDVDHDRILDIITAVGKYPPVIGQPTDAELLFFRGKGDGTFGERQVIESNILSITSYTAPTTAKDSVIIFGDLNDDRVIDGQDFGIFRTTLGLCDGQAGYLPGADYDNDQCVSYTDYWQWVRFYLLN